MTPATEKNMLAEGESTSPLAPRLDLLLQHGITRDQFEADMVRACRQDPEEIWALLALLDQYHRLEILPTELFRALKAAADRYGLVRREPYIPNLTPRPRAPAPAARAPAPTPPPPPPPPRASAPEPELPPEHGPLHEEDPAPAQDEPPEVEAPDEREPDPAPVPVTEPPPEASVAAPS